VKSALKISLGYELKLLSKVGIALRGTPALLVAGLDATQYAPLEWQLRGLQQLNVFFPSGGLFRDNNSHQGRRRGLAQVLNLDTLTRRSMV
jgi:hypothetical protein